MQLSYQAFDDLLHFFGWNFEKKQLKKAIRNSMFHVSNSLSEIWDKSDNFNYELRNKKIFWLDKIKILTANQIWMDCDLI